MRERVVTGIEERLQAGEMQEPLPQGEKGWQEYVRKSSQISRARWGPVPERNKKIGKTRRKTFLNS